MKQLKATKRIKTKKKISYKNYTNQLFKIKERKMRNIKLTIEYDGKCYNGWQKQPDKLNIQGEIEKAIYNITKEKVELIGSGRTDAGALELYLCVLDFYMIELGQN